MGLPKHIKNEEIIEFRERGFVDWFVRSHIAMCGYCRGRLADSVIFARSVGRPNQSLHGPHLGKSALHNFYRTAHEWEDLGEEWFFGALHHLLTCDRCVERYLAYAERFGPSARMMERAVQTLQQASPEPAGRLSLVVLPAGIVVSFSGVEATKLTPRHGVLDGGIPGNSEGAKDAERDVMAYVMPPAIPTLRQASIQDATGDEAKTAMARQASIAMDTLQAHVKGVNHSLAFRLTDQHSGLPIKGARVSAWSEGGEHLLGNEPFEAATDAEGTVLLPIHRLSRLGIWCHGRNWQFEVSVSDLREEAMERERAQEELRRQKEDALKQAALQQKEKEDRVAARRSFDAQSADRRKERLAAVEERARMIIEFRSLEPLDQLRRIATNDSFMPFCQEIFPALDEGLLSQVDGDLAESLIQRLKPVRKGDLADIRELLIARFGGSK